MKKIFLLFSIISIFIISCDDNNKNQDVDHSKVDSVRMADSLTILAKSIKKDSAMKIINNFKNAKKAGVAWTQFDTGLLKKIFDQQNISSAKFFMGAYLNDVNTPAQKKGFPVIILQIKRSGFTDDYEYFEGSAICPPPYPAPCAIEQ